MIGVLLVNMGSPCSQKETKQFLFKMFCDRAILPFPTLPRTLLAFLISNFRYRSSWKKYESIGGSPLIASMDSITISLSKELGNEYIVSSAYSYSLPTIQNGIENFHKKVIHNIKVIPMFPQSSFSTTESVKKDVEKMAKKYPNSRISITQPFSENEGFITYWVRLIQETIDKNNCQNPTLVFSAHAIPSYQVDKGDTYVDEINMLAKTIASKLGLSYKVSFQSKIGKVKWVQPDTKDCLKGLKNETCDEIILVPISFINENLETLFDLDVEIIPYAKNELNIKNICRINIPTTHPLLIEMFKNLLIES
jgi:ferrochelatase